MLNCVICGYDKEEDEIFKLKCKHLYCWCCFEDHVKSNLSSKISCKVCSKRITDADIRKGVGPDVVELYMEACWNKISLNCSKTFSCLVRECKYKIAVDLENIQLECPSCGVYICVQCQKTHRFLTCEEMKSNKEANELCNEEYEKARSRVLDKISKNNFKKLQNEDDKDLWENTRIAECEVCTKSLSEGTGYCLRVGGTYCKQCLNDSIVSSVNSIPIKTSTEYEIEEREIFGILDNDKSTLRNYLSFCRMQASFNMIAFSCPEESCSYFCELTTRVDRYTCPKCKLERCLKCNKSHPNITCLQYADSIKNTKNGKALLDIEKKISEKKLLRCMRCFTLIEKTGGCNWIQCSFCKFEICWILQMPRWGPKGRDDVSGGCKCGVNGKRCHPECSSTCIPHS